MVQRSNLSNQRPEIVPSGGIDGGSNPPGTKAPVVQSGLTPRVLSPITRVQIPAGALNQNERIHILFKQGKNFRQLHRLDECRKNGHCMSYSNQFFFSISKNEGRCKTSFDAKWSTRST